MMRRWSMPSVRCVVSAAILAIAALIGHAGEAGADRPGRDPDVVDAVPLGDSPVTGPSDAPVTIVVWSDYACQYCGRVQTTLDHLARLYPGQLRWVHRTLPLDEDNTLGPEAALAAAAQGRFRPMNDRLFALGGRVDRPAVELLARELGLDMVRFRADLDSRAHRAAIAADAADARALGVAGTPSFFINGRPVRGNRPLHAFAAVIEAELARAAAARGGAPGPVARGEADRASSAGSRALDSGTLYRVGLGLPSHQSGPDDALVTIVVWSDFQCPFCAREAPVLAHLRERYKDDLRIVYRHFAMSGHRSAALAAEAAVAAAEQGKFWAFHDLVFGDFGHLARGDLERFAQAAGLDLARFRAALEDHRFRDAVVAETAAAEALGVDGTPTMFVNGAPVGGALAADVMDRIVDAHLARSRELVKAGVARGDLYAVLMSMASDDERADPSRIPQIAEHPIELRDGDRVRAVAAACRRHDEARATALAGRLTGDARRRAALVCAGLGIDLPR